MICRRCYDIFLICIIIVIIIISYYLVMKSNTHDFLNRKILDLDLFCENGISWWPISHFIFYAVLTFFFPECYLVILAIGIIFEVIEEFYGLTCRMFSHSKKSHPNIGSNFQYQEPWVCGTMTDIAFDLMGIMVGFSFARLWKGRQCTEFINNNCGDDRCLIHH